MAFISLPRATFSLLWLSLALSYDPLGSYMPVSNVLEHSQIDLDVKAFNDALKGDSPGYAAAKDIYQEGGGNSCKSATNPRTLQGFATKDLKGESFADAFYASGLAVNFWDTEILAALDGTGKYNGLSNTKRVTSAKKAVLGLVTYYASHELEAAIQKAAGDAGPSDSGSGHAWDEGWAFYYGSSDGANSPWEVSKKRDANFPDGSVVETAIVPYFNSGLVAVRAGTYSDTAAKEARDVIYKMWAVTYLRAAYKYLEISERSYSEKAHAEGYSYYMAIDGWIAAKDAAAAQTMREALDISKTSIAAGTYCAAKAAMESAYAVLGIDCDMVGEWTEYTEEGQLVDLTTCAPCSASTVSLPSGAPAVLGVVGSATDVSCDGSGSDASESSQGSCRSVCIAVMSLVLAMLSFARI